MRFLKDVAGFALAILVIAAFFSAAMLPQIGLAFFVKFGGGPMIPPIIGLLITGHLYRELPAHRLSMAALTAVILVMANMRGFYWQVFPNGQGVLSSNRMSANAVFLIALFLPFIWRKLALVKRRRNV